MNLQVFFSLRTTASKPSSSFTHLHFSSPPAIPTTFLHSGIIILAICPTMLPVAPCVKAKKEKKRKKEKKKKK